MRKFLMTSTKFEGQAEFIYDDDGYLFVIDFRNCKLKMNQIGFLKSTIPAYVDDLEKSFADVSTLTIIESDFAVTFEMFWETYDMKRNKTNAQELWAKLTKQDQIKAYFSIKAYNGYCARNIWYNKLYPDTYLRKKHFNDEWNKI